MSLVESGAAAAVRKLEHLLGPDLDDQESELSTLEAKPSSDFLFEIRRELSSVVLVVRGGLDVSGATHLGAVLADLIDGQGNLNLVVDLRHTSGVEAGSLGVFGAAAKIATHRGGQLSIREPADNPLCGVSGDRAHRHMVEFYEREEILGESVRRFIDPALREDSAVVVVATKHHRLLFEETLKVAGVDVERARATARYIDLDAEDMLDLFMRNGAPDPVRFEALVASLIGSGGRKVRIYGEMVAVLWAEGNISAALALEDLWNDLGRRLPFSLFCAYPLTAFDRLEATASFRRICEQHASPSCAGR